MSELPEIGKISPEIFNELIYPRLGAKSKSVIVGPQHGVDVGIVEIGGKAVALTTDPVFIVPEYGWERAAWFAIHILAVARSTRSRTKCRLEGYAEDRAYASDLWRADPWLCSFLWTLHDSYPDPDPARR